MNEILRDVLSAPVQSPAILLFSIAYVIVESILIYDARLIQIRTRGFRSGVAVAAEGRSLPQWVGYIHLAGWAMLVIIVVLNWRYAIALYAFLFILKMLPVLERIGAAIMRPFLQTDEDAAPQMTDVRTREEIVAELEEAEAALAKMEAEQALEEILEEIEVEQTLEELAAAVEELEAALEQDEAERALEKSEAALSQNEADLGEARERWEEAVHQMGPTESMGDFCPTFPTWCLRKENQGLDAVDGLEAYVEAFSLYNRKYADEPPEVTMARSILDVIEKGKLKYEGEDALKFMMYKDGLSGRVRFEDLRRSTGVERIEADREPPEDMPQ